MLHCAFLKSKNVMHRGNWPLQWQNTWVIFEDIVPLSIPGKSKHLRRYSAVSS